MKSLKEIALNIESKLGLDYQIVGHHFTDSKPEGAIGFKKEGAGCLAPFSFAAAKGKIVAVDKDSVGWNCSSFYLGFRSDIFPGIERFLSDGPDELVGRECERFVKTPELAKQSIDFMRAEPLEERVAIFKPLSTYEEDENPEVAIFYVDNDQISALIFLLHYETPTEFDRVVTGFMSSCAAVSTMPLKLARSGSNKVVWGHHDLSARTRLPKNLTTLAMPISVLKKIGEIIDDSFVKTHLWKEILDRKNKN